MAPNNNKNNDFKIFEDNTRTVPCPVPSNQNNQFVLQPAVAANNLPGHLGTGQVVREAAGFFQPIPRLVLHGQENLGVQQPVHNVFNTNGWIAQNAPPGANTNVGLLTPAQLHTAYNTSFVPAGAPATVATWNQGYSVEGNWHAGQLHNAVNQRLARPVPDAVPFWTAQTLQRQDAAYRAGPPIPATMWPTPAVGMTMHALTLQVAQQNGMHINSVNPQGHIVWTWTGRQ
ncbi:hypothetical protein NOF04DRAFT_20546 [Fusarium oxysporum II5]|uniref:Uncharacterized protein n=2 Tax=Fusarium oxysporum species complex TaxID=171631 RepID=X0INM7_FUSO5|nr:uncharacterized protein FOIG_16239 [Fusarium odoratissimum NRRL 54006]EXL90518.1 hypothetical protein FOIG_16239 [Fusarium odoratissimum NRRL 54006]KAK2134128.1 hypothetical protein NOF04DRAFT_20546 [Fusarium oxysporum II5]TXB97157.1 hypothetical protein FocTR4_00011974 [Fusarium oxysporum f. sp. cubense]